MTNIWYTSEFQKFLSDRNIVLPRELQETMSAKKCASCGPDGRRNIKAAPLYGFYCECDYGELMSRREAAKGPDKTVEETPSRSCTTEELNIICDTVVKLARIYGENNMCPDIKSFSVDLFKAIFSGYAECRGFKK